MSANWIPMKWPVEWDNPSKLDLIRNTPINCLVGEKPPPFDLGDLEFVKLDAGDVPPDVTVREGSWPAVERPRNREEDSAESGPTGAPWVDSNSWLIRLAQAMEPGKTVWLTHTPPGKPDIVPPEAFALPVAEAEAYGARWVINLDTSFREGLDSSSDAAISAWKKMMRVLEFSAQHATWKQWPAMANLAVISNFADDNEFLSHEFLNLADRRQLAYHIVPVAKAVGADLSSFKAALYIDIEPPRGALQKALLQFVHQGGLLISPPGFPEAEPQEVKNGYRIYPTGQGRIAVPEEEWSDPYLLAGDVHLLMSRRYDVVRIWNGGTMNAHYAATPGSNHGVVHLVSYSHRRGLNAVTLGFAEPYTEAEVFTLDGTTKVEAVKRRLGVEVPLPPFSTYAAIELRG